MENPIEIDGLEVPAMRGGTFWGDYYTYPMVRPGYKPTQNSLVCSTFSNSIFNTRFHVISRF